MGMADARWSQLLVLPTVSSVRRSMDTGLMFISSHSAKSHSEVKDEFPDKIYPKLQCSTHSDVHASAQASIRKSTSHRTSGAGSPSKADRQWSKQHILRGCCHNKLSFFIPRLHELRSSAWKAYGPKRFLPRRTIMHPKTSEYMPYRLQELASGWPPADQTFSKLAHGCLLKAPYERRRFAVFLLATILRLDFFWLAFGFAFAFSRFLPALPLPGLGASDAWLEALLSFLGGFNILRGTLKLQEVSATCNLRETQNLTGLSRTHCSRPHLPVGQTQTASAVHLSLTLTDREGQRGKRHRSKERDDKATVPNTYSTAH